jgi:hypothetical protein
MLIDVLPDTLESTFRQAKIHCRLHNCFGWEGAIVSGSMLKHSCGDPDRIGDSEIGVVGELLGWVWGCS